MQKTHYYFIAATLFGLSMVGVGAGIYFFDQNRQQAAASTTNSSRSSSISISSSTASLSSTTSSGTTSQSSQVELTVAGLAPFDGKNGNKCYVAVDGVIYEILGSSLWLNGQHTTSRGQASCGRDLTQVIGMSPHGRAYLSLPVVQKVGVIVN